MDFKQIIDGLAWIRSQLELDAIEALHKVQENSVEWETAYNAFDAVSTSPPLREAGLEHGVFYAFQARAAYEVVRLIEEHGEPIRELYHLRPAGQSGIGLDWKLLSRRIWVPAPFFTDISEGSQAILSHDESNSLRSGLQMRPEYKPLYEGIDGSSESKIERLLTDSKYRADVIEYSKALVNSSRKYLKNEIKPEFKPVFEAMLDAYNSEMV